MAKLTLINDAISDQVQRYPNKSGTFAMTSDIGSGGGGVEHYRGTDHTTVTSPLAGDYTLENLMTIYWTLPVKFEYVTSWKRTTPLFLGAFGFDETFSSAANSLGLGNFVVGDLIGVTASHAMTSSHTDFAAWDGTSWVNISNSDYSLQLYAIETTLDPLPQAVSNLETAVTALQAYEAPQYYLGSDHLIPTNTEIGGAYTVEIGGVVWFYDGVTWGKVGLQYWTETYTAGEGTTWLPVNSSNGAVLGGGGSAAVVGSSIASGIGNRSKHYCSLTTGYYARSPRYGAITTSGEDPKGQVSLISLCSREVTPITTVTASIVTLDAAGLHPIVEDWKGVVSLDLILSVGLTDTYFSCKAVLSYVQGTQTYSVLARQFEAVLGDLSALAVDVAIVDTVPAVQVTFGSVTSGKLIGSGLLTMVKSGMSAL